MGWERLTLCCAVGMVKCRGDYFGIVGMTYCIRKGKKKKKTLSLKYVARTAVVLIM